MGLSSVQKVARSGSALIIVLPSKIAKILGVRVGDYLKIDWGEVIRIKDKKGKNKIEMEDEEDDRIFGKQKKDIVDDLPEI